MLWQACDRELSMSLTTWKHYSTNSSKCKINMQPNFLWSYTDRKSLKLHLNHQQPSADLSSWCAPSTELDNRLSWVWIYFTVCMKGTVTSYKRDRWVNYLGKKKSKNKKTKKQKNVVTTQTQRTVLLATSPNLTVKMIWKCQEKHYFKAYSYNQCTGTSFLLCSLSISSIL